MTESSHDASIQHFLFTLLLGNNSNSLQLIDYSLGDPLALINLRCLLYY
jgi:hypothetical protein